MKSEIRFITFTLILLFSVSIIFAQIPKTATDWRTLGLKQLKEVKYEQAVESFTKSLELLPDFYQARLNRGAAYFLLKKYDLAIEDYDQVLKFKPFNAIAFYNRGLAFQEKNEHQKAINDFVYAITFNSKHADAYFARSISYCKKGEQKLAFEDEQKAIKLGAKITNPCKAAKLENIPSKEDVANWKSMTYKGLSFQTPTTQTDSKCNIRYNEKTIHFAKTFYCYKWKNLMLDVGYGKLDTAKSKTPNEAAIRRKAAEISFENKYDTGAETRYAMADVEFVGADLVLLKITSDYGLLMTTDEIIYIKRGEELWEIAISYDTDDPAEVAAANRIIKSLSIK